ncbi:protein NCBP2AS2 homolog [Topomyia yanbarensis]|uniref:protein NCBP2AS2 homolog n=1 Tax=Topomyia yanbarensis TaxID=2498891 RepID=UPI00273AA631|nr:protein NCBP2AS2 homolog [Topomyia yanbarensis]
MVLRIILRYLANNEQLIQRLADSYPMRRAAQFLVSAYYRSRAITQEQKLVEITPEGFKRMMNTFKNKIKQETEAAKHDLRKRQGEITLHFGRSNCYNFGKHLN